MAIDYMGSDVWSNKSFLTGKSVVCYWQGHRSNDNRVHMKTETDSGSESLESGLNYQGNKRCLQDEVP